MRPSAQPSGGDETIHGSRLNTKAGLLAGVSLDLGIGASESHNSVVYQFLRAGFAPRNLAFTAAA